MEQFISRWKTEAAITDVANLTYPHQVLSLNGELVAELAAMEDAEALLDWYKSNYDHGKITQALVRGSSARQKLRSAAERKAYLAAKATRRAQEAAEWEMTAKDQVVQKERARGARLSSRRSEAVAAWVPAKLRERDEAVRRVLAITKALKRLQDGMTAEGYAELSTLASGLSANVGHLRTHCHSVLSNKMLQDHMDECAAKLRDQEVQPTAGKK